VLPVSSFRNLPLSVKLCGLTGVPLAFLVALALTDFLWLVAVGVLVSAGLAFVVVREVTGSVRAVIERMAAIETAAKGNLLRGLQALADGDLTVELRAGTQAASEFARDEFGRIMRQAESMRDAIIEAYGAYNQTVAVLRSLIGDVSSTAGSVVAASHQMSSTSEESGKATGEIAQAVSDVAEGTERQVRMVEAARSAAGDVANAVAESAQNAQHAAQVAHETRQIAQEGVGAAHLANEAMSSVRDASEAVSQTITDLAAKSEQIGAIVQTITGIAEQTNLLALNAAIEAARAGEQGRGFAVVAEEVRKLAEESQHAAHEISGLIAAIQEETTKAVDVVQAGATRTADGVDVVEKTRAAFERIESSVDDVTARIEQIASASQQIAASASDMQENITEVATVAEASSASTEEVSAATEETSASAQQIAASAHELASNAEQLNKLVARFHLTPTT
jgi:methyl-accepting chemotaxis protein